MSKTYNFIIKIEEFNRAQNKSVGYINVFNLQGWQSS